MKPAAFEYVRPSTVAEALQVLADHKNGDAKVLAGGQSLIPMMNYRMVQPGVLIDINRLHELDYIKEHDGMIAIGAIARHVAVKAHALIHSYAPLVAEAYEHVAHSTIRNRGTLGGNLVHADSASEMPAIMCALDAEFILRSVGAERAIPANDFFVGPLMTVIEPEELLVEIRIPKQKAGEGSAFEEVSLRKGDFAIAAVAAQLGVKDGKCTKAALSAAGVSDRAVRIEAVEQKLVGGSLSQEDFERAANEFQAAVEFSGTAAVSAEYRSELTHTLIIRALSRAAARATRQSS